MHCKKILEVSEDAELRSCNVCRRHNFEDDKTKLHSLNFGTDLNTSKHSINVCLCTECLSEFAEILWQYLENKEMEKS